MATYNETVTEDVTNDETLLLAFDYTFSHNLTMNEGAFVQFPVTFIGSMTVNDSVLSEQIARLIEYIDIDDIVTSSSSFKISVADIVEIAELAAVIFSHSILENITQNDTPVEILWKITAILDQIKIYDSSIPTGTFYTAVAVAMALADIAGEINSITEDIQLSSALIERIVMAIQSLEAMSLDDVLAEHISFFTLVEDGMVGDDTILQFASLYDLVVDGWEITTKFLYDGQEYTGWVMNPENYAVSNYDNYSFNSTAYFAYNILLANSSGLYAMEGDLDGASYITSRLKTATMSFGSSNRKQIPEVLLGVNNSGKVILTVSVDGGATAYYELKPATEYLDTQQIKVGKGLHGRYWQFELITKENSTFDLDTFEFLPVLFGRKLK